MKRKLFKTIVAVLLLFAPFCESVMAQPLAFPGALGFGAIVTGGRGGTVYHVTTLADSGPGSFRDAVSASNRIVVFDVGGYISLLTAVSVKSNITIAGQTAPGGGIGFRGGEIGLSNSNNIIIRHVRVRPGSETESTTDDGFGMSDVYNIIFDHCSVEFAPWNNIDGVGDDTHIEQGITFMNCIDADPTGQQFGAHTESVGGEWAWYYNVIANSHNRNPLAKVNTAFVNNVLYNCSAGYTTHTSTPFNQDIINNYFILGPASAGTDNTWFQIDKNQSIYYTGNMKDSILNGVLDGGVTTPYWYQGVGTVLTSQWADTSTLHAQVYSAATAYRVLGSRSGALPRDQLDSLVINQMQTLGLGTTGTTVGTVGPDGGLYTSQTQTGLPNNGYGTLNGGTAATDTDGDGMPDFWENATGSNPNVNDAMTLAKDGYDLIEHYINWLATPHDTATQNGFVDIDLYKYTGGFLNASPVYTVNAGVNGAGVLLGDGHTVRFTPTVNFSGIGTLAYTVVAFDGTVFADTVKIAVSQSDVLAPSNLALTATSDEGSNTSTVTVTWQDNSTNETNFILERSADGVTFTDVFHPAANATSYIDNTGLVPNTIYYYRIKAQGPTYVSAYTDTVGIKTPALEPKAPTIPNPTNKQQNVALPDVTLSWTGSPNTLTYSVYFGTDITNLTKLADIPYSTTPSYQVTALAPNTTYYWRIDATNNTGTTTGTNWSFKTVDLPTATTTPSPADGQHDLSLSPTLTWLGSSNTVTYSVYLGTVSGSLSKVADIAYSVSPSYSASGLTDNSTYYWRIDAVNSAGTTTGTEWSFTTNTNPTYAKYRTTGNGNWGSTGSGGVTTTIWQASADGVNWVNTAAIPNANVDTVVIMSGHTVTLNATTFVKNLVIQPSAVLKSGTSTGAVGTATIRNIRIGSSVTNNGTFGSSGTATDKLNFEAYQTNGTVILGGSSTYYINTFAVNSIAVNVGVVIDANVNIATSIKPYYSLSSATGQNDDVVSLTINAGRTVTLVAAAYLNETSTTNTASEFGNYTININGTLDMKATGTSCIVENTGNVSSTTINVNGIWYTGNAMRMASAVSSGTTKGSVLCNIGPNGIVDAVARFTAGTGTTSNFVFSNATSGKTVFFNISGNGVMKNRVPSSLTTNVPFYIGSGGTYSPVILTNTGTADIVSVGVKSSFDNAENDVTKVVTKQYTITPATVGADILAISLGWTTPADQAANFNPAGTIVLGHYGTATGKWDEKVARVTGLGTVASPYYAKDSGYTSFSPFGVGNPNAFLGAILPLNLLSFNATYNAGVVNTVWTTSDEISVKGFTIERSNNVTDFVDIGNVDAKNIAGPISYFFADVNPLSSLSYYRLKMNDKDGVITYSKIVTVNAQLLSLTSVFPNPANGSITITHPAVLKQTTLKVYAVNGRLVKAVELSIGATQTKLNISNLANGNYLITLDNGNASLIFSKQ